MFAVAFIAGILTAIAAITTLRHQRLVQIVHSKRGNRYLAIRLPRIPALPAAIAATVVIHAAVILALACARQEIELCSSDRITFVSLWPPCACWVAL